MTNNLPLVFWLDRSPLTVPLLQTIFEKENINVYFQNEADDIVYLIKDLEPQIIVIDWDSLADKKDIFKQQYLEEFFLQQSQYVLLTSSHDYSEFDYIKKIKEVIKKPFDPFSLPQKFR